MIEVCVAAVVGRSLAGFRNSDWLPDFARKLLGLFLIYQFLENTTLDFAWCLTFKAETELPADIPLLSCSAG